MFVCDGPEFTLGSLQGKRFTKGSQASWLWSSRTFSEPIQDNHLVSYEVRFQGSCHRNGPEYMDEPCTPPTLMHVLYVAGTVMADG